MKSIKGKMTIISDEMKKSSKSTIEKNSRFFIEKGLKIESFGSISNDSYIMTDEGFVYYNNINIIETMYLLELIFTLSENKPTNISLTINIDKEFLDVDMPDLCDLISSSIKKECIQSNSLYHVINRFDFICLNKDDSISINFKDKKIIDDCVLRNEEIHKPDITDIREDVVNCDNIHDAAADALYKIALCTIDKVKGYFRHLKTTG